MKKTTTLLSALFSKKGTGLKKFVLSGLLFAGLATGASAQFIPGLTAKYCLDGGLATDGKGTRHGTVVGAVATSGHLGTPNTALQFNGISDHVALPADVWVAGDFTVAGWLYLDSYGYWERFFEFGNGVDQDNVFYSATTYSTIPTLGLHQCSSSARDYANGPLALPLSQWVHIGITLSGSNVTVYKNGVSWYTFVTSYPPCSVVRNLCYFGRSNYASNTYFHGRMDDIFIFNRAIQPGEIAMLYGYRAEQCTQITGRFAQEDETEILTAVEKKGAVYQNFPNPFAGPTVIKYELTAGITHAVFEVYDISGRVIKSINLPLDITGSVTLDSKEFNTGLYTYGISMDGRVFDRKKMIVTAQ